MKKETKEQEIKLQDHIKPILNKVCIELITEADTYFGDVRKLDTAKLTEPYSRVVSIGNGVTAVKPGDYVLTRYGLNMFSFKIYGKELCHIYESDIESVISQELCAQIKNELTSEITRKSIDIVN